MLEVLELENVGPAPKMRLELAQRLNLLTGDNGLGKSFLLDLAWWALTRKWPHDVNPRLSSGYPARPTDPKCPASIQFQLTTANNKSVSYKSDFSSSDQAWLGRAGRPWNPGLVLYAHADGGFAVWDPARNYWKTVKNMDVQERLPGYVFSPSEVWEGLKVPIEGRTTPVCNGLISDWAVWIRENGDTARRMQDVLTRLSPDGERIEVGPLTRLSVDDARDIPSIRTQYAESVPIPHASAGLRRVMGLAYMLLWSWNEHVRAAELLGDSPTKQVVLLFDEIESHLHPRWQRTILRSLLRVADTLHDESTVQLLAATHSPLVLASAEPLFQQEKDAWFDIDLSGKKEVVLRKRPFVPHGDVSNWLTSEAFDLKSSRSLEAETATERALAVLRESVPSKKSISDADAELRKVGLPDVDPFWVRWSKFVEDHLGKGPQKPTPRQKSTAPEQKGSKTKAGLGRK